MFLKKVVALIIFLFSVNIYANGFCNLGDTCDFYYAPVEYLVKIPIPKKKEGAFSCTVTMTKSSLWGSIAGNYFQLSNGDSVQYQLKKVYEPDHLIKLIDEGFHDEPDGWPTDYKGTVKCVENKP